MVVVESLLSGVGLFLVGGGARGRCFALFALLTCTLSVEPIVWMGVRFVILYWVMNTFLYYELGDIHP